MRAMEQRLSVSRELVREKMLDLLDASLEEGQGTGGRVGEAGGWLLVHGSVLAQKQDDEFNWLRLSAAGHALISCRRKAAFAMAADHDLSGVAHLCSQLALIYAAMGEEVDGRLLPPECADPILSWRALELAVVGAASEASAALRHNGDKGEAQECRDLGVVLLELGAQMALREGDAKAAHENWAAIAVLEFALPDFDPMRVVPLMHLAALANTLNEIASAYTLGKDFEWAFAGDEET